MFIKICGITNQEDARLAVKYGATALGFIFAESKRKINLNDAREIIAILPTTILKVGVFVDETFEEILNVIQKMGLTAVQLHGNESIKLVRQLAPIVKVIKTIKVKVPLNVVDDSLNKEIDTFSPAWKILLEPKIPGVDGGSGQAFDFDMLKRLNLSKVIDAGGLGLDNIEELLNVYRPFGVDACSCLEQSYGRKDRQKLQLFLDKIHRCLNLG